MNLLNAPLVTAVVVIIVIFEGFFTAASLFVYALVTKRKPSKPQVAMTALVITMVYIIYSLFVYPLEQLTVVVVPMLFSVGILAAFTFQPKP